MLLLARDSLFNPVAFALVVRSTTTKVLQNMEDPVREIADVVLQLCVTNSPDVQLQTIYKYVIIGIDTNRRLKGSLSFKILHS